MESGSAGKLARELASIHTGCRNGAALFTVARDQRENVFPVVKMICDGAHVITTTMTTTTER